MSASEIKDFVFFFGFIIGDEASLDVSNCRENHWSLYIELRKFFDLIFLTKVTDGTIGQLKFSIKRHHELFKEFFGKLKPKFHFIIHYPELLRKFGPLVNYWCMRYESRHRELKATSYSASGNKNSLYTVALKEMLKFCNSFNKATMRPIIKYGFLDDEKCSWKILSSIKEDVLKTATFHYNVYVDEEEYKIGDVLLLETEPQLIFGKIVKVINSNNRIFFTLELYKECYKDYTYFAYRIKNQNQFQTVAFEDVLELPPCLLYEHSEKKIMF